MNSHLSSSIAQASNKEKSESRRFKVFIYALHESFRSALNSIFSHGLRSFLTILGIIIGVASVIAVTALIQGLSQSISSQFQNLGGNTFSIRAYTSFEDTLNGKQNRLKLSDLEQLEYRIDDIEYLTPTIIVGGEFGSQVRNGRHVTNSLIMGTTSYYQDVQHTFPKYGRFLTRSDNETRRRVVVIGEELREKLKLPDNPSGDYIQISDEWFKIVGVMEARGEIFGISQDNYLLIPYQTAISISGIIEKPDLSISFAIKDMSEANSVKEKVTKLMRQLHELDEDEENDFVVESSETLEKSFKEITTTVTLIVAGVVGISLLVGGVGIMNIMLVSVTERTREIGILKALGAPRHFILMQFLIESVVLAFIGGIIGLLTGYLLSVGIASLIPNFATPVIPFWVAVGSCLFSGLIGVVFGILPASNAANLTPVNALRYE